jgi:uncharacterized protein
MTDHHTQVLAAPVRQEERIDILDSLRGVAILGILLMNIPGFGLPENQVSDPSIFNESGLNYKMWFIIDWVFAGTQRAFFSMLFGAGIILFIGKLEKKTDGLMAAEIYFRRQLWLLVFGLFNAFVLLWFWDILFAYAICGMILFAFRRLSPKVLIVAAIVSLLLMTARENVDLYRTKAIISKGEAVAALDTNKVTLSEEQRNKLQAMLQMKADSDHPAKLEKVQKEIKAMTGSYAELYAFQSEKSAHVQMYYNYYLTWDLLIFMFVGMAFFKNGLFLGKGSTGLYASMFVIGVIGGLALTYIKLQPSIEYNFSHFEYSKHTSFELFEVSRVLRSFGFFGLILLMYKLGWFKWLFKIMQPVGQMAFTNYLMQSLMCGLFFYGVGLGYFGKLQRYELYYVVAAVWIIEIVWSNIWLKYYRFGPLEWTWRSLTYWQRFPNRR